MSNEYYVHSGIPATRSQGSSAQMRAEFAAIMAGFDRMPRLGGNAGKALIVNAGGSGVDTTVGRLTLGADLIVSGAFATSLVAVGNATHTLPGASGTLATLAGTETLTNKTLTSPTISNPAMSGNVTGAVTYASPTILTPTITGTITGAYDFGGTPTWPSTLVRILVRDSAYTIVSNTASETTLWGTTIPAGTLGVDRAIRLTFRGSYSNSSGANRTVTFRMKYGSTTLSTWTVSAIPTGGGGRAVSIDLFLCGNTTTLSQDGSIEYRIGAGNTDTGTAGALAYQGMNLVTAAEDSGASKNLTLTVQHDAASAFALATVSNAYIELV